MLDQTALPESVLDAVIEELERGIRGLVDKFAR
jgi:hypothetical protein